MISLPPTPGPQPAAIAFRGTGLTESQAMRLFKAAIKDDEALIDVVIERVFAALKAFDRERAYDAIELVVDRDDNASLRLGHLLEQIRTKLI
jgi:hypothetical protein